VVGALLVGLGWVALAMAVLHLKINFFNFIALPISFGIGVDYARQSRCSAESANLASASSKSCELREARSSCAA